MAVLLAVWDPWRVGAYLRSTAFDRITRELSRQTVRDMSATLAATRGNQKSFGMRLESPRRPLNSSLAEVS